jgi:hypothetical protein
MPPGAYGESIASVKVRKLIQKSTGQRALGEILTYITCQKGYWVRLIKNLTLRGSSREPRSLPVRERVRPPTYYSYITNFKRQRNQARNEATKGRHFGAVLDEVLLEHVDIPRVRLFFAAQPAQLESCFIRRRGCYEWTFPLAVHLAL